MSFQDVRHQVATANRVLAETGLASGVLATNGHASLRVPGTPDRFVIKGRGYRIDALSRMRPADMIVCDLDGNLVEGPSGGTQPFEVKMHSCIYRMYPDVQSIVHVHARYVVVMSVLEVPLVPMCQEGIQLVRKPLPVYPHVKTIQTDEEGEEVASLLGDNKAMILQGHGSITVGASLDESVLALAAARGAGPHELVRLLRCRPRPQAHPGRAHRRDERPYAPARSAALRERHAGGRAPHGRRLCAFQRAGFAGYMTLSMIR